MSLLAEVLQYLSVAGLGLLVGSLLIEGAVLVPTWRSLTPGQFMALHPAIGPRLFRYFLPLTASATLITIAAAIVSLLAAHPGQWLILASAALGIAMVVTYTLYFEQANAKFSQAAIAATEMPAEGSRWAAWHWLRIALGLAAFGAALLALKR